MTKHDLQRRIFLRGALTAGCVLTVPALFVGCDRKEPPPTPETSGGESTQQPATPTQPGMNGGESPQQPATPNQPDGGMKQEGGTSQPSGKVSQEQVQYQDQPKGDQRCDNCQHFVAENNTCGVVEGQISPQGWCAIWVKLA